MLLCHANTLPNRYIGSEKAIAELPFMNGTVSSILRIMKNADPSGQIASGGVATYLFWRSAYLSTLFSLRNRTLVATDWLKVKLFGRYVFLLALEVAGMSHTSCQPVMSLGSERIKKLIYLFRYRHT